MEFIRRNSDYALRSLAYLSNFPKGQRLTVEAIAAKGKVPIIFLRKIFQRMAEANIISSRRGPRGGFCLVRSAKDLSLKDIIEAVQGRISLSNCLFEDDLCTRSKRCGIRKKLSWIQKRFVGMLDEYTLSDFCADNGKVA